MGLGSNRLGKEQKFHNESGENGRGRDGDEPGEGDVENLPLGDARAPVNPDRNDRAHLNISILIQFYEAHKIDAEKCNIYFMKKIIAKYF